MSYFVTIPAENNKQCSIYSGFYSIILKPQKAAKIEDRILELSPIQVNSTNLFPATSLYSELLKKIKTLQREITILRRSHNSSRNRPKKPVLRNSSHIYKMFWYHHTFQSKTKKCSDPCSYKENLKGQEYRWHTQCQINLSAFFVRDRKTKTNFLIDTSSDCSLLPATKQERSINPISVFIAANGTPIIVYAHKLVSIDLGLRKQFVFLSLYAIFHNINRRRFFTLF